MIKQDLSQGDKDFSILANQSWFGKYTCTLTFTETLFAITKTQKQPKCPSTDKWIKNMWYIYIMEYYSVIKKNRIMPFAAT